MANPFVHLELNTSNLAKAKDFYGELFGWTFNDMPFAGGVYTTFKPDKEPGGGLMSIDDAPTGWLAYVGVEDIKAASKKAAELGAQVLIEAQEIPNVGWFSVVIDPTGARIAMFQPKM